MACDQKIHICSSWSSAFRCIAVVDSTDHSFNFGNPSLACIPNSLPLAVELLSSSEFAKYTVKIWVLVHILYTTTLGCYSGFRCNFDILAFMDMDPR